MPALPAHDVPAASDADLPQAATVPVEVEASGEKPFDKARAWIPLAVFLVATYTAYFAQPILLPIVVSVLLALLLAPAVRVLQALRIPRFVGALIVVALTIGFAGGLLSAVAEPAQVWIQRVPEAVAKIEKQLKDWRRPIQAASDATDRVLKLGQPQGQAAPVQVVMNKPSPMLSLLRSAPSLLTSLIASVFLLFLLLLHADHLSRKVLTLFPSFRSKRDFLTGTKEMQSELSRYLLAISVINLGLGICTTVALWWLGVPDSILWGGMVALLNFAPYVGPVIATVVLILVGYSGIEYSGVAGISFPAYMPAAVFLVLHAVEGQVVTPLRVGRHMALDPVVIFLSLMLMGWLWGIVGLLIAVPLLTCFKVTAQRLAPDSAVLRILTYP